jgi:hypothetical protein
MVSHVRVFHKQLALLSRTTGELSRNACATRRVAYGIIEGQPVIGIVEPMFELSWMLQRTKTRQPLFSYFGSVIWSV